MERPYDAVLMIAYGGPDSMDDVRPFLANIVRGKRIPPQHLEKVVDQYRAIGGKSPLNDLTRDQADRLAAALADAGLPLPVHMGMRNWPPMLADVLAETNRAGLKRILGMICSIQQCDSSWGQYERDVAAALETVGADDLQVDILDNWHDHPLFIEAATDQVSRAVDELPADLRDDALIIFSAHSIPTEMLGADGYVRQTRTAAEAVAARLGRSRWEIAYQSRSGRPGDPWLEPDIRQLITQRGGEGVQAVVVVPIGFVCDHVEVLYDLDIAARAAAADAGLAFARAGTVGTSPAYIRMLVELISRRCQHPIETTSA
ncbi:MAG: ferrochelatase [bacterium]|nr:ferrochelatase [bacterium]